MKKIVFRKKYEAYTLLELLVVISIILILGGMSLSAFGGLQNTIRMNEYMLNLEQDVRNVQRAAMLLQRNPNENWIYGLGLDMSEITNDGNYRMFKWCTSFSDYGDITTRSPIPGYDPVLPFGGESRNGYLPIIEEGDFNTTRCAQDIVDSNGAIRGLQGYASPIKPPAATIQASDVAYILFESVSGRAFFYNINGVLLNYDMDGNLLTDNIIDFEIEIIPSGKGSTRSFTVKNLSGKIDRNMY